MNVTGDPIMLVRALDGRFVRLTRSGAEVDFGFIRADILSPRGFEIARNGIRHGVSFEDFDIIHLVS